MAGRRRPCPLVRVGVRVFLAQLFLLVLLLLLLVQPIHASGSNNTTANIATTITNDEDEDDSGTCSHASSLYLCPNQPVLQNHCTGNTTPTSTTNTTTIYVQDCMSDCPNYRFLDAPQDLCFDRQLFGQSKSYSNDEYPVLPTSYLWNDLVGMIVWFVTAGIAMACGVGGGGIFVPLGILLFQFTPKPASGLSQASIFGAALGGLLLNAIHQHPAVHVITDKPGIWEAEEKRHIQNDHTTTTATTTTTHYYTRPLIHYDMALFLSPMEMAGALLGVLIQRVLPNWLYLLIVGVVLGLTAGKTFMKYCETHHKEDKEDHAPQSQVLSHTNITTTNMTTTATNTVSNIIDDDLDDGQDSDDSFVIPLQPLVQMDHVVADGSSIIRVSSLCTGISKDDSLQEQRSKEDDESSFGPMALIDVELQMSRPPPADTSPTATETTTTEIVDNRGRHHRSEHSYNHHSNMLEDDSHDGSTLPTLPTTVSHTTNTTPNAGNHGGIALRVLEEEESVTHTSIQPRRQRQDEPTQDQDDPAVEIAYDTDNDTIDHPPTAVENDDTLEERQQRIAYLQQDMRQYPYEKIAALVVLWMGLFLLTLLKGGKGVESLIGITCHDHPGAYAGMVVCQFVWLFGFALYYGHKAYVSQQARIAVRYPYLRNDPHWDAGSLRFYGACTFAAGIVAGLIGIGGGMILGPLMLVMGIHPLVSSATTATMIVLTSSSVAVMFVTSGMVPWEYAVFYFSVCFCGAMVGKTVIDDYVKRTGHASMLIFILATIIALATVGCIVILFLGLANDEWCLDGFHSFCTSASSSSSGGSESEEGMEACPVDRLLEQVVQTTATFLLP